MWGTRSAMSIGIDKCVFGSAEASSNLSHIYIYIYIYVPCTCSYSIQVIPNRKSMAMAALVFLRRHDSMASG